MDYSNNSFYYAQVTASHLLLFFLSRRSREWFAQRGFDKPVGAESAGLLSQITWSWVWPLLQRGNKHSIHEDTAEAFVREDTRAPRLASEFDAVYDRLRVWSPVISYP